MKLITNRKNGSINRITKMPNWCENYLTIEGDAEDLKNFYIKNAYFCESDVGSNKNTNLTFRMGVPGGVENAMDCWGTKWDACDVSCEGEIGNLELGEDITSLDYEFQTAWSPPTKWMESIAQDYPELTFKLRYIEPGCDFWGYHLYLHGEEGIHISDSVTDTCQEIVRTITKKDNFWNLEVFSEWYSDIENVDNFNWMDEGDDLIEYMGVYLENMNKIFDMSSVSMFKDIPKDDLECIGELLLSAVKDALHECFVNSMKNIVTVQSVIRGHLARKALPCAC